MARPHPHLARAVRRARDLLLWYDVTQLVKSVAAAVVAWVIAAEVLDLPQPFLAPWSALLVVHATVYRTFSRGVRQVGATVVGVLLAAVVGHLLGLDPWALAVLLTVAMLLGWIPWFGAEATTLTTTALIVLTTGWSDDSLLYARLIDTGIGVATGLVVNALVWPPLQRDTATSALRRIDDGIGRLVHDIGVQLGDGCEDEDVEDWIERSRSLDGDIDDAWAMVRQAQESARLNPRQTARHLRDPQQWFLLLHRMEQTVAEVRSMARTLGGAVPTQEAWHEPFGSTWPRLLVDAGEAVAGSDDAAVRQVRQRLAELVAELGRDGLSDQWPVHGALVCNLDGVLEAMEDVVRSRPLDRAGEAA